MTTNGKEVRLRLLAALQHLRSGRVHTGVAIVAKGLYFGLLAASFIPQQTAAADNATPLSRPLSADGGVAAPSTDGTQLMVAHHSKLANFEQARASGDARHVANWVVDSGDNRRMPFAIVDKRDAQVFVFDADGRLRGAAPALLGLARGDDSVPGIGNRKLSSIRPDERTTPAGRFVAALGSNARGEEILWIDYDGAVSMHRVIATKNRLARLATPTPLDNRISYGCINVPTKFYENVVRPAFTGTNGIVYVLPETKPASKVFASYDVEEKHAREQAASQAVPAQVASGAARNY